jgi:hypothetical protein
MRNPPVKVYSFLPRLPAVSEEYFHEHWRDPHGEIAKNMRALRRYVQSHRVEPGLQPLSASPYDGVAVTWSADLQEAESMQDDHVYRDHLAPDELLFIDMPRLRVLVTSETLLLGDEPADDDAEGAIKAMVFLKLGAVDGAAGLLEALRCGLRDPVGDPHPAVVLSTPLTAAQGYAAQPPIDAVLEAWFESEAQLRTGWRPLWSTLLEVTDGELALDRCHADLHREIRIV